MSILYVGGFDRLIASYKKVSEELGHRFQHHNGWLQGGGEEKIYKKIQAADVIICPVDIVSHNAVKILKKHCQKNKKIIYIKRSSISSYKRTLHKLTAK